MLPSSGSSLSSLSASLSVQNIDMCLQDNKSKHNTSAYDNQNLVVRRGLEFMVMVTLSRPLTPGDDFQVEFLIGGFQFLSRWKQNHWFDIKQAKWF